MPTKKELIQFLSEQLSGVEGITFRPMMGEYLLYCKGVLVGGVYDDRLLLKITPATKEILHHVPTEIPYHGAKEMFLIENVDDKAYLCDLFSRLFS